MGNEINERVQKDKSISEDEFEKKWNIAFNKKDKKKNDDKKYNNYRTKTDRKS